MHFKHIGSCELHCSFYTVHVKFDCKKKYTLSDFWTDK